jgi:type IV pilus assembly protein PilF
MTKLRVLPLVFFLLVVGGCASTTPSDQLSDEEDAARSHLQLGIHYMRQGNLNEAKRKMEQSLEFDDSDPMAHATIALLYEQINDIGRARRHYRRALRLGDEEPAIRNNYGTFLCRQGDYREAEEQLVQAARNRLYDTPAAAWTNAGACVRRIPDLDAAENYFRNALRVQSEYGEALWHLADLKFEQGEYLNARAFAQRLIEQGDPIPDVLLLAVRIEDALGAELQAQEYADQLKRLYPESRERNQLAELGYE